MSKQRFGGDWTAEKLERLRKYLSAYATIMNRQQFKFAYIDAFAGTGYSELKDTANKEQDVLSVYPEDNERQVILQGSARIALQCRPEFHRYIFVEKSEERFGELQDHLLSEFTKQKESIIFVRGDANSVIQELCEKNWRYHRAVMFLDPFGMQVKWQTVKAIAKTEAIDLWILFPLGVAVNRMLTKDGKMGEGWKTN